MAKPTKEFNPETGQIEAIQGNGDSGAPAPRRSYKKGGDGYAGHVLQDGFKVYYRSLEAGVFRRLIAVDKEFGEDTARIMRESKPVRLQGNKTMPGKLDAGQAEVQSLEAVERRQNAQTAVLKSIVVGWEFPDDDGTALPCTPETIEGLPYEVVAELCESIQQKSGLGKTRNDADFLGGS